MAPTGTPDAIIQKVNADVRGFDMPARATAEQYQLFQRYQDRYNMELSDPKISQLDLALNLGFFARIQSARTQVAHVVGRGTDGRIGRVTPNERNGLRWSAIIGQERCSRNIGLKNACDGAARLIIDGQ